MRPNRNSILHGLLFSDLGNPTKLTDTLVDTVAGIGPVAGWRVLFLSATFPAPLVFVIRSQLAGTPYYLAKEGQIDEASERIEAIAEENGSDVEPITAADVEAVATPPVSRLFAADVRQQTLMIGLVQIPGYLSAAYLVDAIGRKLTLGSYLRLHAGTLSHRSTRDRNGIRWGRETRGEPLL